MADHRLEIRDLDRSLEQRVREQDRVGLVAGRFAVTRRVERDLEQYADGVNLQPRARTRFFDAIARHTGVHPDEVDIRRLSRDYQVPALIVHDRNDVLVPFEHGERMAAAWPGAEFLATEGLGHWRILTDPRVVGRASDFLVNAEPLRRVA